MWRAFLTGSDGRVVAASPQAREVRGAVFRSSSAKEYEECLGDRRPPIRQVRQAIAPVEPRRARHDGLRGPGRPLALTMRDGPELISLRVHRSPLPAPVSSDARCNTPPSRFGIGRIETSGSVAMRGYSHLSDDEREQIGLLKVLGYSIGAIARALRRPKSTISRELSRNRLPSGRYSPLHAAGAYQLRRRREALIEKDRALRSFVLDRLAEGWTPEQIAGWLKAGNERRLRAVGCETIYAFIYRAAQKAEQLWRYLTRRHKRRRPRRSRPSRDTTPSMNDPKISTPEPRLVIGRATSSSASAHGRARSL